MDKQRQIDQLFIAAKTAQPHYSFDETKEKFLSTVLENPSITKVKKSSFLSTKNWIIMLTTISTFTAVLILLLNSNTTKNELNSEKKSISESKQETTQTSSSFSSNSVKEKNSAENYASTSPELTSIFENPFKTSFEHTFFVPEPFENPLVKAKVFDDTYVFPKLTEEEIKENNKQKKAMLKALEKFDKKAYSFIPAGTFEYKGKTVSLQAFYMQKMEVTNLEYRTFLFDLLIQNRKEEFLKAKPDQAMWTKLFGEENKPMEELYFSHVSYNEYPVVNVTREGVELYCKWLSQELVKFVGDRKEELYNDVRIPLHVEWVKAASAEGKQLPYPWDGKYLRDSKGFYLANFKSTDSTYLDDGGFFTVKVNSYTTNSLGLYNMSGNVSEMVYDTYKLKDGPITVGGGWMNNAEEIKILGPDPYAGNVDAHPNIGFRVVMTIRTNAIK